MASIRLKEVKTRRKRAKTHNRRSNIIVADDMERLYNHSRKNIIRISLRPNRVWNYENYAKNREKIIKTIDKMSLDEMLSASENADTVIRGGRVGMINSANVKDYVELITHIKSQNKYLDPIIADCQKYLSYRIIKKNRESLDRNIAQKSYYAFKKNNSSQLS